MKFLKQKFKKMAIVIALTVLMPSCSNNGETEKEKPAEPVNVELFTVKRQELTKHYTASAILAGKEEAIVTSDIAGKIEKFLVNEGDFVAQGDTMALIETADYRLELEKAETIAKERRLTFKRLKKLKEKNAISNSDFDNAKTNLSLAESTLSQALLNLERTVVKSPMTGEITKRIGMIGKRVMPGELLFRVVDTELLKMLVALSDKEIVHLNRDDNVEIKVDAWPGETFPGKIVSVRVSPDSKTASFPVEIEPQKDRRLKPGMVARVTLKGQVFKSLILIPTEALLKRIGVYYLFIYKNGYAKLREVEIGMRLGKSVEIKNGLEENDIIVKAYSTSLKDGSPLKPLSKADKGEDGEKAGGKIN